LTEILNILASFLKLYVRQRTKISVFGEFRSGGEIRVFDLQEYIDPNTLKVENGQLFFTELTWFVKSTNQNAVRINLTNHNGTQISTNYVTVSRDRVSLDRVSPQKNTIFTSDGAMEPLEIYSDLFEIFDGRLVSTTKCFSTKSVLLDRILSETVANPEVHYIHVNSLPDSQSSNSNVLESAAVFSLFAVCLILIVAIYYFLQKR